MPWNLISTGTSVIGKQYLNCRVGPNEYFSLVVLTSPEVQQKFWGVLSAEFLNTPETGDTAQSQIIKVWTKRVVATNKDPFNDADLFMFWRFDLADWEIWRFG